VLITASPQRKHFFSLKASSGDGKKTKYIDDFVPMIAVSSRDIFISSGVSLQLNLGSKLD
jgi:hypothetical protein